MREGETLWGRVVCRRAARIPARLGGGEVVVGRDLRSGATRPMRHMLVACAVLIAASAPVACASHTPMAAWQAPPYSRAGQGGDVLISPPAVHHAVGKSWASPGHDSGARFEGLRPSAWDVEHEQPMWADISKQTPKAAR